MVGQTLGQYRILEQIGAGGMGVVYKAEDMRLKRRVALKFLPEQLCQHPQALGRFLREACSAASLNHPRICTIHAVGEHQGRHFIVMEFLEGESLKQRLQSGSLPNRQLFDWSIQIADALEAAHEKGILHRDIKPGNIFLTRRGEVKLLDFGLAKQVGDPKSDLTLPLGSDADPSLTTTGATAGTAAYMSPEQARAEKLDARSDIFSLGVVLYEMATGRPPFAGRSMAALFDAILNQDPTPVPLLNPAAPAGLGPILSRAMAKDRDARYPSAAELKAELQRLAQSAAVTGTFGHGVRKWLATAALLALVGVAAWLLSQKLGGRPAGPLGRSAARIESIAVLPLANLSGDPQQEYFADGMTEELTTNLAQVSALRVISRTSVMQYKGSRKPMPEIARELNVDAVIEGSVLRAGNQVRITAQLIRAANDQHLWAQSYDRDLGDVLGLQSEVARDIARQVQAKLTPQEQARLAQPHAVNSEVYDLYLKGLYHLHQDTEKELRSALDYFQRVLDKNPQYAPAYAGLAASYATLSTNYVAPRQVMPQAKEAALKALELDQNLAEAHAWLGLVSTNFDWDAQTAGKELTRALELNPNSAEARTNYAWFLSASGRHREAMEESRRAVQIDPFSLTNYGDLCWVSLMSREYDVALSECRRTAERTPDFGYAHSVLGLSLAQRGRYPEAIAEAQRGARLDDSPLLLAFLAQVEAQAGDRREALRVLEDLRQLTRRRYVCSYEVAAAYVHLGEKDEAFRWLDKGVEDRSDCMVLLAVDPRMDGIRSDPRYLPLLRRVGFAQ